jgi:hypothetical protein
VPAIGGRSGPAGGGMAGADVCRSSLLTWGISFGLSNLVPVTRR